MKDEETGRTGYKNDGVRVNFDLVTAGYYVNCNHLQR